jgi:mRNA-degrading endonuclease YafQ of YafQ-DinJ toxin-antitoxin module
MIPKWFRTSVFPYVEPAATLGTFRGKHAEIGVAVWVLLAIDTGPCERLKCLDGGVGWVGFEVSAGVAAAVEATLEQFSTDSSHPSLRTHKLLGLLASCWACSAGYDLRIAFEFVQHEAAEAILLLAMGTYDQVYWRRA